MQPKKLTQTLEEIKKINNKNQEYWSARELYPILGYTNWRNFKNAIQKAIESCKSTENKAEDHFDTSIKMVELGSEGQRDVEDYHLTRYACYLVAQNGNPRIPEIAFAQMYFALQTRKQEVMENQLEDIERLIARKQLIETEKEFAKTAFQRGIDGKGIAEIHSAGDFILFGNNNTKNMKRKLLIKSNRSLADFLPTVTIKAKDLATEATAFNTKKKNLYGKDAIKEEHLENNKEVREFLLRRDIKPEELPVEEDLKKVERKYKTQMEVIEEMTRKDFQNELLIEIPQETTRKQLETLQGLLEKFPGNGKVIISLSDKQYAISEKVEISENLAKEVMKILQK